MKKIKTDKQPILFEYGESSRVAKQNRRTNKSKFVIKTD